MDLIVKAWVLLVICVGSCHASGCGDLFVDGADYQTGIVGEYERLNENCGTKHAVYRQKSPAEGWGEIFYLYYYDGQPDEDFTGWVFSLYCCTDAMFARNPDPTLHPEDIKELWEEKMNGNYVINRQLNIECEKGLPIWAIALISLLGALLLVAIGLIPYCFLRCAARKRRRRQSQRDEHQSAGSHPYASRDYHVHSDPAAIRPAVITLSPPPYSEDVPSFSDVTSSQLSTCNQLDVDSLQRLPSQTHEATSHDYSFPTSRDYSFPTNRYNRLVSEISQDERNAIDDAPPPSYEDSIMSDNQGSLQLPAMAMTQDVSDNQDGYHRTQLSTSVAQAVSNQEPFQSLDTRTAADAVSDNQSKVHKQTTRTSVGQSFVMDALAQAQLTPPREELGQGASKQSERPPTLVWQTQSHDWQPQSHDLAAAHYSATAAATAFDNQTYDTSLSDILGIEMKPAKSTEAQYTDPSDANVDTVMAKYGAYSNDAFTPAFRQHSGADSHKAGRHSHTVDNSNNNVFSKTQHHSGACSVDCSVNDAASGVSQDGDVTKKTAKSKNTTQPIQLAAPSCSNC